MQQNNRLDKLDILQISIDELRSRYLMISTIHDQLRARVLALSVVVTGFITYSYATFNNHLPTDISSRFLLLIIVLLLLRVVYCFVRLISSTDWEMPMDSVLIPQAYSIHHNKLNYLKYVQDEYLLVTTSNMTVLRKNGKLFNQALYLLIVSVIILVVVKEAMHL
jgi:hypothetical protein